MGPASLDEMRAKISIPSRAQSRSIPSQDPQQYREALTRIRGAVKVPPRPTNARTSPTLLNTPTPDSPKLTTVPNPPSHHTHPDHLISATLLATMKDAVHIPDRATQSTALPVSVSGGTYQLSEQQDGEQQDDERRDSPHDPPPRPSESYVGPSAESLLQSMRRMVSIPFRSHTGGFTAATSAPSPINPTLETATPPQEVRTVSQAVLESPQRPVSAYPNVPEPSNLEKLAAARRSAAIPSRGASMPSSDASRQYVGIVFLCIPSVLLLMLCLIL